MLGPIPVGTYTRGIRSTGPSSCYGTAYLPARTSPTASKFRFASKFAYAYHRPLLKTKLPWSVGGTGKRSFLGPLLLREPTRGLADNLLPWTFSGNLKGVHVPGGMDGDLTNALSWTMLGTLIVRQHMLGVMSNALDWTIAAQITLPLHIVGVADNITDWTIAAQITIPVSIVGVADNLFDTIEMNGHMTVATNGGPLSCAFAICF